MGCVDKQFKHHHHQQQQKVTGGVPSSQSPLARSTLSAGRGRGTSPSHQSQGRTQGRL